MPLIRRGEPVLAAEIGGDLERQRSHRAPRLGGFLRAVDGIRLRIVVPQSGQRVGDRVLIVMAHPLVERGLQTAVV